MDEKIRLLSRSLNIVIIDLMLIHFSIYPANNKFKIFVCLFLRYLLPTVKKS